MTTRKLRKVTYFKNILILSLIGLLLVSCRGSTKKNMNSSETTYTISDSTIFDTTSSVKDIFIQGYADSINKAETINELPEFLKNSQFDFDMSGLISPIHHPISLRNLIMKKVTNCNSLKLIIKSNEPLYKNKPSNEHEIELELFQYSFYDFALARIKELKCY